MVRCRFGRISLPNRRRCRWRPSAAISISIPNCDRQHSGHCHRPPFIPIIARAEPTVLFTRRTDHLSRHAGQVSFPGGRANADDSSLVATALRETHEEIGVTEEYISVAGFTDAHETGTGYAILPVVGVLREGFSVVPEVNEVAGKY